MATGKIQLSESYEFNDGNDDDDIEMGGGGGGGGSTFNNRLSNHSIIDILTDLRGEPAAVGEGGGEKDPLNTSANQNNAFSRSFYSPAAQRDPASYRRNLKQSNKQLLSNTASQPKRNK